MNSTTTNTQLGNNLSNDKDITVHKINKMFNLGVRKLKTVDYVK